MCIRDSNYPVAKELKRLGIAVDMICGFRSKDIVIMEDEFRAASDNLYITTDLSLIHISICCSRGRPSSTRGRR